MSKVSVILPFISNDEKLERAIYSVLEQPSNILEIILVCDNPHIDRECLLQKYDHGLLHWIFNDQNLGAGCSRRLGIEKARGEFIAFLDADDEWINGKLTNQLPAFNDDTVVACCTAINRIKNGVRISRASVPEDINYYMLLKNNYVPMSSSIVRASCIRSDWMTNLRRRQDYLFWLQLLKNNPKNIIKGVNMTLVNYHITDGSLSSGHLQNIKFNYLVFREGLGFSVLKSAMHVAFNIYMRLSR